MIQSMTGYGALSLQSEGATVAVEIRTVNHRFLDLHVRIGREYGFLEAEISQLVRQALRRGRIDLSISVRADIPAECLINLNTARSYLGAAERLRAELHLEGALDLQALLAMPGVLQSQNSDAPASAGAGEKVRALVLNGVHQALDIVLQMRRQEGGALASEMRRYLGCILERVSVVRGLMPVALLDYRQRLEERLKYLLPQVAPDPQRLAQEVALLAEKSDISEEVTRLESHIDQYASMLDDGEEAGKKLDFLLQEMQREVNTILSKTGNLEVTRHGIGIKADIEKLREQVQNVE
jgi:uncharacterized protein (TIGR00255 family)